MQAVHQQFELQVTATPDATAVVIGDTEISYTRLNGLANRIAHTLIARGIGPGDFIGVCLDRSVAMVAGILGVLKAGAAYVPLDTEYPADRLAYMLEDSGVRLLLTHRSQAGCLQIEEDRLLLLDEPLEGVPDSNPDLPVTDDQLIYMIYTSGSTGKPKGSLLYHRGFQNLVDWYVQGFGFDRQSRVLHMTSPAFDLTQKNLFAPLVCGGRLCLLSSRVYDANIILDHIERNQVTVVNCTPSAFSRLLNFADDSLFRRIASLRYVFLGGEPIVVARLKAWLDNPHCRAQVVNTYGPTECTDVCVYYRIEQPDAFLEKNVPIGQALPGFRLSILDDQLKPVPAGEEGQLGIAGIGVGKGYHNKPEMTAERFVPDPMAEQPGERLYLTGDRARLLADGNIDYLGRIDNQVKVRGFRIELGEIERVLEQHSHIKEAAVTVFPDQSGDNRLAAYLVYRDDRPRPSISDVRAFLQKSLPDFMLPTAWVALDKLPLTPNGKLDRKALPTPQAKRPGLDAEFVAPKSVAECYLANLWLEYLGLDRVGIDDRFFELGGSSLNAVDFIARLGNEMGERIPITTFFAAPTIRGFIAALWADHRAAMQRLFPGDEPVSVSEGKRRGVQDRRQIAPGEPIAIIGMAGRFPGAADVDELWENLLEGVEAVRTATDEEMRAAGVSEDDITDSDYVRNYFSMDEVEYFDAAFFGYQPREVEAMDPQHRLFLETAWVALDNAGYADTEKYDGRIGVFGGIARDAYLHHYVSRHPRYRDALGEFSVNMGNDKNFPCTRVAYKFNLSGPAINVQTACSTSGVALHLACQSLRAGESDIALVGGCRVLVPTQFGYRYVEGSALSRDGHLYVFDRRGTGMVRGSGAAFLVVKRLSDALADGDCIRAIVKSTAINNDGSAKVGFTAPSIEGQSEVIAEALQRAGVKPETIGYVEAHGTATALGDPIEVRGLTRAYRQSTEARQSARLGSIKSNIGHLDAGAAAAGIIKTVLSMEQGELPASLNYEHPNPDIDFSGSPFTVNSQRMPWPMPDGQPRRAGVSSFGLGGTNFHCILEQAPAFEPAPSVPAERHWHIVTLSAKSDYSLQANIAGLRRYVAQHPEYSAANLAFSLNCCRPEFPRRAYLLCSNEAGLNHRVFDSIRFGSPDRETALVYEFPARNGPLLDAAPGLFRCEPVFRAAMQACAEAAAKYLDGDLCHKLYPLSDADSITEPDWADIAQFALQYALAKLWLSWGVRPQVLLAEGVGEIAAACVAGVLSLDDAIELVIQRSRALATEHVDELIDITAGMEQLPPAWPVILGSTGELLGDRGLTAEYWQAQAAELDVTALLPSPRTHLVLGALEFAESDTEAGAQRLPALGWTDEQYDNSHAVFRALGELWLQGQAIDWRAVYDGFALRKVPLPPFRFERQRFWADLPGTGSQLLTLSADNEQAVSVAASQWSQYLAANPDSDLHPLAAAPGTSAACRFSAVITGCNDAVQQLTPPIHTLCTASTPKVVFMFPGGGAQYLQMGRDLYRQHPVFKQAVDEGMTLHAARTGYDLSRVWFPRAGLEAMATAEMARPSVQLPALFIIEVALARLWQHWGVQPEALLGHSMGENTAACVAGVMAYADALGLVALRGRLFEQVEPGGMLSVGMSAGALQSYLGNELDLATVNGPEQCTVSGRAEALNALQQRLEADGVDAQVIPIAIAAHSRWLDPILSAFGAYLHTIQLKAPAIPFISNLTGDWITDRQAVDPDYWVQHLRRTVRFGDGIRTLLTDEQRLFLECGPGKILGSLVKMQGVQLAGRVVASLRHAQETISDRVFVLNSIGRLWSAGAPIEWSAIEKDWPGSCLRLPLQPPAAASVLTTAAGVVPSLPVQAPNIQPLAIPNQSMPVSTPAVSQETAAVGSRKELIISKLKNILYDMSGIAAADLDVETTFLNMGFDSLFLTQANLRFKKALNVKITLRQLLNEAPTLSALAEYIDQQLPADALQNEMQPAAPAATPAPVATPAAVPMASAPAMPASGDALQQAIALQIQASNALLNLIQAGTLGAPAATAPQVQAPVTPPPATPAPTETATEAPAEEAPLAHGPYKPMQKSISGELTSQQQDYLKQFIADYQQKTQKSKAFAQRYRPRYADPRTVMGFKTLWKDLTYTLVGERSKGSHVWDVDGNEYIDCMSGFGAIFFGHAPDFILDAVKEQLDKTVDYGPQSQLAGPAAELLCELTGMERASFCNTGSEAVLAAMRLARTVTGNELIVVFSGDYHGIFDEVLVRVQSIGNQRKNRPVAPGIPQSASQNILVLDYGDPKSIDVIRERADEIAAVLIEPIQSRRPELTPKEFLHQVRQVTRDADIPMIFDEIITGFRLHPKGAQAWFDVEVDIACYGKVVGGGFPVGVVAGKAKYLDALDGGQWQFGDDSFPEVGVTYFAGTFIRHPVAIASVYAALNYMKEAGPGLQLAVNRRTAMFAEEVSRQYRRRGIPIEINYFGSVFLIRFHGNADFEGLYHHHLRFFGAHHIWGNRPGFLTAAHSEADIAALTRSFIQAGEAMQRGGFLPALEEWPKQHYPWTSTQSELWLAIKMGAAASAAYNEQVMFEIEQDIDPEVMALALDKVINRHPSLRAVVDENEQGLTLQPYMQPEFSYEDLRAQSGTDLSRLIQQKAQANIDEPFDFYQGPLLRMLLLRVADRKFVLCVCASHLVCDGWSLEIVMEDIAAYYSGICQGRYKERRPVPSLDEFLAAEKAQKDSGDMDAARQYWLNVYGDHLPPDLDLPLDRQRPRQRSYSGERLHYYLDTALNEPMRQYAKGQGCTSFVMMLSVYELMIHRLTGQNDLVVGIPAAGQPYLGLTSLVAHGVSFLPLRTTIDPTMTFGDFMVAMRDRFMDAKDSQIFGYGELLKALKVPRDSSRLPLVTVSFNLDMAFNPLDFDGAPACFVPAPRGRSKYDLLFTLTDEGDRILIEVDRNKDILDGATIERWVAYCEHLLKEVLRDPQRPIGMLPMMDHTERSAMLDDWNATDRDYPLDTVNLHQLVEQAVAQFSDRVAVEDSTGVLSFNELDAQANRVARYLRNQGVKPDQVVPVLMQRSRNLVVVLYGILKSGGAYLPLDPEHPDERIRMIIEESGATLGICQRDLANKLPDSLPKLVLDSLDEALKDFSTEPLPSVIQPDNLAYVIYTSGSTGRPKGVMNEHRGICNRLLWMQEAIPLTQSDRVLQKTPYTFDVSVWEFFLPLMAGCRLVVADPGIHKDSDALIQTIMDRGITYLHFVPSMLQLFLSNPSAVECGNIRCVISSGEALSAALEENFFKTLPNAELYNLYGPTEAAVDVTFWSCRENNGSEKTVPIGRPVANTQIYILDEKQEPTPVGVPGELYIGGVQVARGYLNRRDLTAERFVEDAFSGKTGARLYRTGDLARYRPDGVIEYLGRNDFQVKIRGLRIELGEIEAALKQHPSVEQCVVTAREDRANDQRLVAYWVAQPAAAADNGELREHLRALLPDYMVPQHFVQLDTLPLTDSGKIDRKALPEPDVLADQSAVGHYREPQTDIERAVADLWCQVLGVERVGIDDDFFSLGGHSLLGTQIFARLNRQYNIRLGLHELFDVPTVAKLSALIEERCKQLVEENTALKIEHIQGRTHVPASSQQKRLWYLGQIESDYNAHNLPAAFRLTGELRLDCLQKALNTILQRQAALRTNIVMEGGELIQSIREYQPLSLTPVPISEFGVTTIDELAMTFKRECAKPFNLERDSLFRIGLVRVDEQDHVLYVIIHHLIFDGWSFDIFLRELFTLYNAYRADRPNPLPELPVSYADYAIWQQQWLASGHIQKQLDYWVKHLSGELPVLDLPLDRPRPATQPHTAEAVLITIEDSLLQRLDEAGQRSGGTLFMTMLALYAITLYRFTRQSDLLIGAPISGRNLEELGGLLGFFVNTLIFRLDVDPNQPFSRWLKSVKQRCLEAYDHQDTPFELIIQNLDVPRDQSRSPVYQTLFIYQDVRNRTDQPDGMIKRQVNVELAGVQTDLDFWMKRELTHMSGGFEFPVALFDRETIAAMADSFMSLVRNVAENPDIPIDQLIALNEEEWGLLNHWNATQSDVPLQLSTSDLLDSVIAAAGDRVAIVHNEKSITYRELDKRTTQLAHYLKAHGVQCGTLVGVCLKRTERLPLTLLSIWKAGGSYLPLDPDFPETRIEYMLDTSRPSVLVTESEFSEVGKNYTGHRICIDREEGFISNCSDTAVRGEAGGNDLAYVIFTSGSTGKPKGVQVPHRAVVNFLSSVLNEPGMGKDDKLLSVTTLSFDIAVLELFLPLLAGATLVIAGQDDVSDGRKLKHLIENYDINIMQATPSTWRLLFGAGWQGTERFKALCGGEALPQDLCETLVNSCGSAWNMYGPTETTVWSTCQRLARGLGTSLIGRPLANTTCHVVDERMKPVPVGVPGELLIGGAGVTEGYLGRPDLTSERFITGQWQRESRKETFYRTGDRVRWRRDGTLEYFQRLDNQVKVRGFRIELGEVECVLHKHPQIRECAAMVRNYGHGDQRLVAYLCFAGSEVLTNTELRRYLRNELPEYMIPQMFVEVQAMPLTPNGKIDRKALPEPLQGLSREQSHVPPRTEQEKSVARIWCEALKTDSVSIDEKFFDIGGHSLLALSVIARIEKTFGVRISPLDMLMNTLEQIAAKLTADEGSEMVANVQEQAPAYVTSSVKKGALDKLISKFRNY